MSDFLQGNCNKVNTLLPCSILPGDYIKPSKRFLTEIRKEIVFQSSYNLENIYPIMKRVGCFIPLREISGISKRLISKPYYLCTNIIDNYFSENEQVVSWQTG